MPECVSEEARSLIQHVIELTYWTSISTMQTGRAHTSKTLKKLVLGKKDPLVIAHSELVLCIFRLLLLSKYW